METQLEFSKEVWRLEDKCGVDIQISRNTSLAEGFVKFWQFADWEAFFSYFG